MSVYVGKEDWREDCIKKWEYYYYDSHHTNKTSRVRFSDTNQVHEIALENEVSPVGLRLRRSKRKAKKQDMNKAVEMLKLSSLSLDSSLPAEVNYKILLKKLRKFRTTSWVVRVCTDFVQPVPVLQVSTHIDVPEAETIVDLN